MSSVKVSEINSFFLKRAPTLTKTYMESRVFSNVEPWGEGLRNIIQYVNHALCQNISSVPLPFGRMAWGTKIFPMYVNLKIPPLTGWATWYCFRSTEGFLQLAKLNEVMSTAKYCYSFANNFTNWSLLLQTSKLLPIITSC